MDIKRIKYNLPGGSLCEVHKVFGDEYYIAIVEENGVYPEKGKIAKNINRDEYMYLITGEMTIWINGIESKLKENDSILAKNGSIYKIDGKAKCIVFVKDGKDGKTEIIEDN